MCFPQISITLQNAQRLYISLMGMYTVRSAHCEWGLFIYFCILQNGGEEKEILNV